MLRHAMICGIQHLPRQAHPISDFVECSDQFFEKRAVPSDRQAFHVFEHEIRSAQFSDNTDKLPHQGIAGVIEHTVPDQREALAGGAATHDVDRTVANPRRSADRSPCKPHHRPRQNLAVGEIEFVDRGVNGVDLDRSDHVETRLLEPEAHAARTGE